MRTKSNKAELLAVLDEPALALHNNAAELAVNSEVNRPQTGCFVAYLE